MKNLTAVFIISLILTSCTDFSGFQTTILGSWRMEESTSLSGENYVVAESKEITFMSDGFFVMEIYNDYMDSEFGGKYFILENSKRHWPTLTLIPNTYVQRGDTISLACESYAIVSINDSVMILQRHTEFIDQGSSKAAVYNRKDRYLRSD